MTEAESGDRAWVVIRSPLSAADTVEFCGDIERLFRINSALEILAWRPLGGGQFAIKARNLSTERELDTTLRVTRLVDGWEVAYGGGLKSATRFTVAEDAQGARLTVTDDYSGTPEAERRARLDEVDRSLVPWGRDIHRYLKHWRRWSWLAVWRWYMRRVWQKMTPRGRRITFILFVITVLELATFALVVAIYALELDRRLELERWFGG
jgi:hypothetical protein